jgi:predicted AAA+ superfamily ATPase
MTNHLRTRHLQPALEKLMKASPCVGLVGMRQVGKTTLLKRFAKSEFSFDAEANVARFERESKSVLQKGPHPLLLDEVQKYPKIFEEIKYLVDMKKKPGQFLLTGSVRFTSKKDIRESLTGRIVTLELLPLGLAEAHNRMSSSWLDTLLKPTLKPERALELFKRNSWATLAHCEHYLKSGGLPGICFHRDTKLRADQFASHLDTLLGRDIQYIYRSKLSVMQSLEVLRMIAIEQGLPMNQSLLARKISTTPPTIQLLLNALEQLFLIRSYNGGYFIEDQGLASHLAQHDSVNEKSKLLRLVWSELQQKLHYSHRQEIRIEAFHSKSGGGHIPFVIKHKSKSMVAIFVENSDAPSNGSLKISTWFQKKYPSSFTVFLHKGAQAETISSQSIAMPLTWIF